MIRTVLLLLPWLFWMQFCRGCEVIEEASGLEKPCVFPFTFRGVTYNDCTSEADPDGNLWCSTKVNETGNHIGEQSLWGFCENPSCFQNNIDTEDPEEAETTTILPPLFVKSCEVFENATDSKKECSFPFKMDGKIYNGCTDRHEPNGKFWCPTKLNSTTQEMITSFWGWCEDSDCSIHMDDKTFDDIMIDSEDSEAELPVSDLDEVTTTIIPDQDHNIVGSLRVGVCSDCRYFRSCPWSVQAIRKLTELKKTGSAGVQRRLLLNRLRSRICSDLLRTVCCDSDLDTVFPSPKPPATTSTTTSTTRPRRRRVKGSLNDRNSGLWRPRDGSCGTGNDIQHVVGGSKAKIGEFPYMALLGKAFNGEILYPCGGSIINKWYILTAAHCIGRDPPIVIRVGEYDTRNSTDCNNQKTYCINARHIDIDEIIVHEDYDPDADLPTHDIALIRVKTPIPLSSDPDQIGKRLSILPVCLPWRSSDPGFVLYEKNNLLVTGWGRTSNDNRQASRNYRRFNTATAVLHKLFIPAIARTTCMKQELFKGLDSNLQICAGGQEGKDSCSGDSGSPLVYRKIHGDPWYQVGIVSFGTRECGIGQPGVYTRISAFIPWIKRKMRP